jgi:hypothetical protein
MKKFLNIFFIIVIVFVLFYIENKIVAKKIDQFCSQQSVAFMYGMIDSRQGKNTYLVKYVGDSTLKYDLESYFRGYYSRMHSDKEDDLLMGYYYHFCIDNFKTLNFYSVD